jgi:hypothetical protein
VCIERDRPEGLLRQRLIPGPILAARRKEHHFITGEFGLDKRATLRELMVEDWFSAYNANFRWPIF